jgi:hypothetical protein
MISVKKLIMVDSPEIMEQKIKAYCDFITMSNGDGEFGDFSQVADYFNDLKDRVFDVSEKETFIVSDIDDVEYIESVFNKINFSFKIEDHSSKYFNGTLDINMLSTNKKKIVDVFLSVLTVDDVLDKIRVSGEDSLNYIDKLVLKNF